MLYASEKSTLGQLWMRQFCLSPCVYLLVVFLHNCIAGPYHGSQHFLGYSYWNNRYSSLNFPNDWPGFWNNNGDPKNYDRPKSEDIRQCAGCSCSDIRKELTCSGTPTSLQIRSRSIFMLKDGDLPKTLTDVKIYKSGLRDIEEKVFYNLTVLAKLNLAKNQLDDFPDISQNGALVELDLFSNKIKLWNHNYTSLPKKLKRIILTDNEIDWIPDRFFDLPELEYISLSMNKLKKFPGSAFVSCKLLRYIGIDDNKIDLIAHPDMEPFFGNNSQLVHLNLSRNNIASLPSNTFQYLTHLQVLELHQNQIGNIGSQVFYKIPQLLHLDLRYNKLEVITAESYSPAFEDLPKLKCLILMQQKSGSKTKHVMVNAFKKLPLLEDLWLNDNALTNFPHPCLWYESRNTLKYLHIENNHINSLKSYANTDFPPDSQDTHAGLKPKHKPFEKIPGLERLFAHNNQISEVGEEDLWVLNALRQLYIGSNNLKNVTVHAEAFRNLTSLSVLHMDANKFHYVPLAVIGKNRLPSIIHLDLQSNKLTYILNNTFSELSTLSHLDLRSNKIVAIENGAFPPGVAIIQLGSNRFNFKHENQFTNLGNLQELNLENNLIDIIPDAAFHGLPKLSRLRLTNNKIGRIMKIAMRDLTGLSQLFLEHNQLAFIEDGALSQAKEFRELQLDHNHLTALPAGGDFHNKLITNFDVSNNRITSLRTNTFVNVTCTEGHAVNGPRYWNFRYNSIAVIEEKAFVNSGGHPCHILIGKNGEDVNPLKTMSGRAFDKVQAGYIDLRQLQLTSIAKETFRDVNVYRDIQLENNPIESVEDHSFIRVQARFVLFKNNKIQAISGPMWGDDFQTSTIHSLDLSDNLLKTFHEKSLKGVKVTNDIILYNNRLTLFPAKPLKDQKPTKLDLSNNQIGDIPVGDLDTFTNLDQLILRNNNITVLGTDLFKEQTKMWKLALQENFISIVQEGAFNGLIKLEELNMRENQIVFLPTFPHLPRLETLDIHNNRIVNIGQSCFGSLPKLASLNLGGTNKLGCDCNVYNSLVAVDSAVKEATCVNPPRLAGVTFGPPKSYLAVYVQEFTCSPIGINVTAPGDYQLKVEWDKPSELYPALIANQTRNGTIVNTWETTEVTTITYPVTCYSANAPTITTTSMFESIIFGQAEGVKAGTDYTCYVMMNVTHRNGTNIPPSVLGGFVTRSTPKSEEDSVTTVEGKAPATNTTMNLTNFYIDATYFDFRRSHIDFVGVKYEEKYKNPTYVASPFGSWLAISNNPVADSFSKWFLQDSVRNMHYEGSIELRKLFETDANWNNIFRHFNAKFFPLDGRGFGAEGQRDCYTNALRNYGFTTTVKASFRFSGQENFAFAGGEELWVFINKQMVTQIFHDPKNSTVPCRTIDLAPAARPGGGVVTPKEGSIVNGKCQEVEPAFSEAFNFSLRVGETYRIDLFLAERFECNSVFLYQTSGVQFVRQWEPTNPVDFVLDISENIHVGAVVLEFEVGDVFSSGPYTVEILSGNDQERFEVKEDTYSNPAPPSVIPPPYFTWKGKTVYMCPSPIVDIPIATVAPAVQTFNINTKKAKLVVKQLLNFEATTSYLLTMKVTDTGLSRSGNVTFKVLVLDYNDHCPVLPNVSYVLKPIPPLQKLPFFTANATDGDSGVNAEIVYSKSEVWEAIPEIEATKYAIKNFTEYVWNNKTVAWTYKLYVYAIDGGIPRRGDRIPLTISFNATCQEAAEIFVNEKTGEVFFRAPGFTNSEYPKKSAEKPMCRCCRTGFYCIGDGTELPCGVDNPAEYSFAAAKKCSLCPEGWLCKNGTALPCPDDTYVKCNASFCPDKCTPCEPGTYCFQGRKYECRPGEYSDGTGGRCTLCPPGSYNNVSRAGTCHCCPAGYSSSYMKTSCRACPYNEWAHQGPFPNCSLCQTCSSSSVCPCLNENACFPGVTCRNLGSGNSECDPCPEGYEGDGRSCTDTNECALASPCFNNASCVNLLPGYRCRGCPPGYRGNAPSGIGLSSAQKDKQQCVDVDECLEGNHACDPNAKCINTLGSFKCGLCNPGYIGDGYAGCAPGDLCTNGTHTCSENSKCVATAAGKYKCVCKDGYGGDGEECELDPDLDAIPAKGLSCTLTNCRKDNCPKVPNTGQEDNDGDTDGDSCDDDDDNDLISDKKDNCQFERNLDQADSDNDGVGDACDNCVNVTNPNQVDTNADGQGDACDDDDDGDGTLDSPDRCPKLNAAGDQTDADGDLVGDLCDNCPNNHNTAQTDTNQNGYGDPCDGSNKDKDGDGVLNEFDNCVDLPNGDQADADEDKKGDACDEDQDNDGKPNLEDNCRLVPNPLQEHDKRTYDVQTNAVGDKCIDDFDGDGVKDDDDPCPNVRHIGKTGFLDHFVVDLYPSHGDPDPNWHVGKKGVDVEHVSNTTHPGMLIGEVRYGPVDYKGTMYVKGKEGSDYIGVVFGYQSNAKFYVVMWRQKNVNFGDSDTNAGIKGLQLKMVNSATGPGSNLAKALWHSGDTSNQVTQLWCDPEMKGWEHEVSYAFHVVHRPSIGLMRVIIKQGETMLTDSGKIYDTTITGGRVGMFVYGQQDVIWSRLEAKCLDRVNMALVFDGKDDHVVLPSIKKLGLTDSFTLSTWVQMAADYGTGVMPIICNKDDTLCLYIKNRLIHGNLGSVTTEGSELIEPGEWHHLAFRYDAQRHELELYVNGTSAGKKTAVKPYTWTTLWGVRVPQSEILSYMKLAGLTWPIHKGLVRAHYNMEGSTAAVLQDQGGGSHHGSLVGEPVFAPSSVDKNRFFISYPNNRRRRSILASWLEHREL